MGRERKNFLAEQKTLRRMLKVAFGNALRRLIETKGVDLKSVAQLTDMSPNTLFRIVNASHSRGDYTWTLDKVADILFWLEVPLPTFLALVAEEYSSLQGKTADREASEFVRVDGHLLKVSLLARPRRKR